MKQPRFCNQQILYLDKKKGDVSKTANSTITLFNYPDHSILLNALFA